MALMCTIDKIMGEIIQTLTQRWLEVMQEPDLNTEPENY